MLNTVFFGGSEYVIPVLRVINPIIVVTTERNLRDPVIKYCSQAKINYLSITSLSDETVIRKLKENLTDVAVLANFGLIVPNNILRLFPKGIVNIHPSLLPKYRGPTPAQVSILNGDKKTGVSLIKLDAGVDHGPIIAQAETGLPSYFTSPKLYKLLFEKGAALLEKNLKQYVDNTIIPLEQNHSKATFTAKLTKESGFFDYLNPPTPDILDRMIRAYHPWPSAWTKIEINGKLKLVKFLPARNATPAVTIEPEILIQVEGGKPLNLKDFYNGYPQIKQHVKKLLGPHSH